MVSRRITAIPSKIIPEEKSFSGCLAGCTRRHIVDKKKQIQGWSAPPMVVPISCGLFVSVHEACFYLYFCLFCCFVRASGFRVSCRAIMQSMNVYLMKWKIPEANIQEQGKGLCLFSCGLVCSFTYFENYPTTDTGLPLLHLPSPFAPSIPTP